MTKTSRAIDTRGEMMSDEKLRGLCYRFGFGPTIYRCDRARLLACVRRNNLIERTWSEALTPRG